MQGHTRRIQILAATGVVAAAVLTAGSAAGTKAPGTTHPVSVKQGAQLVQLQPDRDGGETYVWMVNGVQRGLAFR